MNFWFWKKNKPTEEAAEASIAEPALQPEATPARILPDLARVEDVTGHLVRGPFAYLRPAFTEAGARMSAQLCITTYTMDLQPWADAGWDDFSLRLDSGVTTGITVSEETAATFEDKRVQKARQEVQGGAGKRIVGSILHRNWGDTAKAICMMHPLPDGKFLLAIGFMGTLSGPTDWIANLNLMAATGFHTGFAKLCDQFESSLDEIEFPHTAEALGMKKLTLREVLQSLKRSDSRFRLWMAGHSRGAAMMQIFAHRLLYRYQITPQNFVGYGFASPSVASANSLRDPAAYPLYHILNTDDAVPRVGGLIHLGLSLNYAPDDAFRKAMYVQSTSVTPEETELMRPFMDSIQDTLSLLIGLMGFITCIQQEKGDAATQAMQLFTGGFLSVLRIIPGADAFAARHTGQLVTQLIEKLVDSAQKAYLSITGHNMPQEQVLIAADTLRPAVQKMSVRRMGAVLSAYFMPAHAINPHDSQNSTYLCIVNRHLDELRPSIFTEETGKLPQKRYAEHMQQRPDFVPAPRHIHHSPVLRRAAFNKVHPAKAR